MKPITSLEIKTLTDEGVPVLCIDVREGFRQHLLDAGGMKVPFNQIQQNASRLLPYKNTLTVVCCMQPKGSGRTKKAERALRALGFTDVRELFLGLHDGWIKSMKKEKMPVPTLEAIAEK